MMDLNAIEREFVMLGMSAMEHNGQLYIHAEKALRLFEAVADIVRGQEKTIDEMSRTLGGE